MSLTYFEKNFKTQRKKRTLVTALILILTVSAFMAILPSAYAHTPAWNVPTYVYVAPTPPIVGVNQQMLICWWLNALPPTAFGAYGDRWKAYVDVIKPDGTKDTFGPLTSDPVGGGYLYYTPNQLGNYSVVARFPGQVITGDPTPSGALSQNVAVNDTYSASTSIPEYFKVQQAPIPSYVETPLPTGYWTRPISDVNRGWGNTVMGQWLGGAWFESLRSFGIPNTSAPESAHVLWSRSSWSGGVMGGYTDTSYYNGIAYEGFSSPLVVLEGKAYYQVMNPPDQGWYCIDLYTGQTLYFENNTDGQSAVPTLGQVLNWQSPNQDGGFPYLWRTTGVTVPNGSISTTTWQMLDGFSGKAICKIANVSTAGTQFRDSIGSICYLNIVNLGNATAPNYYMQIWNTTQAIWWRPAYGISAPATLLNGSVAAASASLTDNSFWMWRPGATTVTMSTTTYGAIYDGRNGYTMNVSIANLSGPWNNVVVSSMFGTSNATATVQQIVPDKFVIVGAGGQNDGRGIIQGFLRAISLAAPTWGQTLWTTTFTPPAATDVYPNATYNGGVTFGGVDWASGTFRFIEAVTGKVWVYSITTGQQLWSAALTEPWYYYGTALTFHNGKAYTIGTAGVLDCFNATTGKLLWTWTAPNIGYLEVQGTTYTPLALLFFVDDPVTGRDKIYLDGSTGWAGQTTPIRRDSALYCLDTITGQMLWRLEAYPSTSNNALSKVILDEGRIIYLDNHDNQIYCLGTGLSATTVSAPQSGATAGSVVTITGTVTDQSPSGRYNVAGSLDFTLKGTPAISDASMGAWMEYMFQQRPMPTNATGVPVTLTAVDPNNNTINIGTTTSGITGTFGYAFTPEHPGMYRIIATFAGSAAYGGSFAETYLAVGQAPSAAPVTTLTPTQTATPTSTPVQTSTSTSPSPSIAPQPTSGVPTTTYIAIGAAVIIIIAAATAIFLRKRKK
jgi:outer membrane protein assembly factor BamB